MSAAKLSIAFHGQEMQRLLTSCCPNSPGTGNAPFKPEVASYQPRPHWSNSDTQPPLTLVVSNALFSCLLHHRASANCTRWGTNCDSVLRLPRHGPTWDVLFRLPINLPGHRFRRRATGAGGTRIPWTICVENSASTRAPWFSVSSDDSNGGKIQPPVTQEERSSDD
jgi:hypothetical protein